ncbi:RHS repeat domain-containing protein [Arcobacter sp. FWKO B]|uniref:RHS repeat domain-containing protein n=1 Tax=Arcobacter sp. FWKO B TaxID=2593672 RepID=UPI001907AF36|nr:RHS repeat-associated core domain-containing protein [Arcobacter sp. FWKO B]
MSYNPLSQRASKYYKDKDISYYHKYIYDNHNIIGIYDGRSDRLLASFIHTPKSIDKPLSITIDKQTYYYHLDINNSVVEISDEFKNIVQHFTYDDFGYIIDRYTSENHKELEILNPYTYTSREYDTDELYYYRARYYDPSIKRFISPDPISYQSGDTNFYAYVNNNPINLTDPSGLKPQVNIPNSDVVGNIYTKNIANNLPQNPNIDILTPPPSPINAEPMGKDGFKVRGSKPKLDIGKTLYFVFYDSNAKHTKYLKSSATKVYNEVKQEISKKPDKQHHIVYLQEVTSANELKDFVQSKIEQNGGKEKVLLGSIEAIRQIPQSTSIYQYVKNTLNIKPNQEHLKPKPYFQGNIDQQSINTHNENILRNEKLHKTIASKEHQKYVMMEVAEDLDGLSDNLGLAGAVLLVAATKNPKRAAILAPIGKGLTVLSEGAMYGKHLFKYFADEFDYRELTTDVILAKTVFIRNNELIEYYADKTISEYIKNLYEDK